MLDALEECGAATEAGIQQRAHATRHSLLERHRYLTRCSPAGDSDGMELQMHSHEITGAFAIILSTAFSHFTGLG